ncbi:hypothetical protein AB0J80_34180 [Actinoplanes sp. NPDC049548]|uniref:hypothetical protein n=1 Tax=Actinoplanes sp. NPDC049548 TaxID=3155152 RepID=UPI00342842BD
MDLLIAIDAVLVLATALVTFAVVRRDLGRGTAAAVSAAVGAVVGLSWFLVVYLAVAAYVAALLAYVVARRLWSVRAAALGGVAAYGVVALASLAAFWVALDTM